MFLFQIQAPSCWSIWLNRWSGFNERVPLVNMTKQSLTVWINGEQYPSKENHHQPTWLKDCYLPRQRWLYPSQYPLLLRQPSSSWTRISTTCAPTYSTIVKIAQFSFKLKPQLPANVRLFLYPSKKEWVKYLWALFQCGLSGYDDDNEETVEMRRHHQCEVLIAQLQSIVDILQRAFPLLEDI